MIVVVICGGVFCRRLLMSVLAMVLVLKLLLLLVVVVVSLVVCSGRGRCDRPNDGWALLSLSTPFTTYSRAPPLPSVPPLSSAAAASGQPSRGTRAAVDGECWTGH